MSGYKNSLHNKKLDFKLISIVFNTIPGYTRFLRNNHKIKLNRKN